MNSKKLSHVDDSVHVMLKHDKRLAQRQGKNDMGYVPRAPHPLVDTSQNSGPAGGEQTKSSNSQEGGFTAGATGSTARISAEEEE
jgi:hypothetical protein